MRNVSQENPRNEVPRAFLETAIERFQDHAHDSYAELFFYLDEMGISEWEDCTEGRLLVRSTMRRQAIFHRIH
jgi:hypothetical protein